MIQKKTTIDSKCANCDTLVKKSIAEYKRRLCKLPDSINFFCCRGCGSSYRNKHRLGNGKHLEPYQFAQVNTRSRLYDERFTWYIHRLTTDNRRDLKYTANRLVLQDILLTQWNHQGYQCAITGVELSLKVGTKGICVTSNPFYIASIDRVDNSLPYKQDNIQWVSKAINLARGNCDIEQFTNYTKQFLTEVMIYQIFY